MKNKKYLSEIFLGSSYITKESWDKFLLTVATYIGYFDNYELVINIYMNECRYFILSNKELPSTLGDSKDFFMKKSDFNIKLKIDSNYLSFIPLNNNMFELYDKNEIKNKLNISQVRIKIKIMKSYKYKSKTRLIFEKNNKYYMHKIILSVPKNILSVEYKGSRFFYRKKPKYLNIQKSLHLLKGESSNSILKVDTFPYLVGDYYLNQNSYNFDNHSLIVGSTGTGKSKLMSLFVNNFNNSNNKLKYRIVIIDPHASLIKDIAGLDNLKILDYTTEDKSANITSKSNDDIASSIENTLLLFQNLMKEQYNSKIERILRHSIHILLLKNEFSFFNIRRIILDTNYRLEIIKELSRKIPDAVMDFFLNDFNELKTRSYTEAISPIVSFIDELLLLPSFNRKNNNNDIKDIIKDNFITLFSLDKNKIGSNSTKIITNLVISKIFELVQSNILDEHIILMIDEVSNVETPILSKILSEARKFNLSIMLATQYFNQISNELRKSIFTNISNYYVFRVSKEDAKLLEDNMSIKMDEDKEEDRIKMLSELNDRECIVRVNSQGLILPAIKAKTIDFIPRPKKEIDIKTNNNIIEIDNKENILERPFNIKSQIKLNDIMIEQSTSRKKVR